MEEEEVTTIVRSLARYLRAHPLACDSALGIAEWWLAPGETSMDVLERALDWLMRHGALEQTAGADGRRRFRRCGSEQALDAAVAARAAIGWRGTP